MHSKSQNTSINVPNEHDIEHNIPKEYIVNDKFLAWIYGRAPVDRLSDKLINDKPNKLAAYHYWGTIPLL